MKRKPGVIKETRDKITSDDWLLFQRALKAGTSRTNHVRVNVVGNHGVGKSTLIKRLLMQEVKCPDPDQTPTENLEVHHLIARCVEKNGKKVWENDTDDSFLEDLNIQRMAQAMIETSKIYKDGKPGQPSHSDQANMDAGLESGSDYIIDESLSSTVKPGQPNSPYSNLVVQHEKKDYLKKVLHTMDQLESENSERQYVSYWDFAGQSTYYATHQLFMSPLAVYLLVIDLRKDLNDTVTDNLDFRSGILQSCTVESAMKYWIHSVQAYTKDENGGHAPIIIVGTHSNDVKQDEIETKFSTIRRLFNDNFPCKSLDSSQMHNSAEFDNLRSMIIDNCLGVNDKKITSQWINLEYDMQMSPLGQKQFLKFSELKEINLAMDLPITDVSRLEAFLCHQHYKGKLLFYHHDDLKDIIITEPMMMVKFLNLLLRRPETYKATGKSGWNEDGILDQNYIQSVAKHIGIDEYAWMLILKILVKLHILHPISSENVEGVTDKYFLPCLLSDVPSAHGTQKYDCYDSPLFQLGFKEGSIYQTVYHQLLCALLQKVPLIDLGGKKMIYNLKASLDIENDSTVWLTIYWQTENVYFYVKDFKKGKSKSMSKYVNDVLKLLADTMEDVLAANQYGNVECSFSVECPDHPGVFLCLAKLHEGKPVLCSSEVIVHMVSISDVASVEVVDHFAKDTCDDNPVLKETPSDKLLARLAWKLKSIGRETAAHLAQSLKMACTFVKADIATRDFDDPGVAFLSILIDWRNKHGNKHGRNTCSSLLDLLCGRQNYDRKTLIEAMLPSIRPQDPRIDNVSTQAATDNKDIVIIGDYLTTNGFTFVLIELGLTFAEIEHGRRNHFGDTREMVRTLLRSCRAKTPETATTRAMLKAMRMIDIAVEPIIAKLE